MIYAALSILADATPPPQPSTGGLGGMLVPMIAMGVIFYFLLIRPQQKKQKEQQALINSAKTGDKIITSAGIHGLISNVKETTVIVKIADNVKVEIEKSAILTVTKRSESESLASV
jgi:preprotein translocase subunit YajC